jgi:site-specific DNA-cytosine methylase
LPGGVVLLELFGGIAPALEAALHAGWPVKQYLYVDSDPTAIRVAQHRCATLQLQHPALLPPSALEYAFAAIPQDVYQLSDQLLAALMQRHAGQWLVVGGWECQDLSPAGSSKGLQGLCSSTFYPLMRILRALQTAAALTERGHVFVMVGVEAFTRWVVLVPLRNKEPVTTAFASQPSTPTVCSAGD